MQVDRDCPQILREFLSYHETIKGQSKKTVAEYYLDLRMFLRFVVLIKNEMPYDTDLDTVSIKNVDTDLLSRVTVNDIYDFLSYLANDRVKHPDSNSRETGIGSAAPISTIRSLRRAASAR